jgi:CCR4-NOT transcription complex subunit 4
VRNTTKSQQRKQRKDALKQDTKAIVETSKEELEVHAPVLGRKKKQKKEKAPKAPAPVKASTPAQEAASEEPTAPLEGKQARKEKQAEEPIPATKPEKVQPESIASPKKPSKGKGKATEREKPQETPVVVPEPVVQPSKEVIDEEEDDDDDDDDGNNDHSDETEKPEVGPYSVFQEIKDSLWTSAENLYMLKPVSSSASRGGDHSHNKQAPAASPALAEANHCKDYICKCGEIQEADLADLRAGKPVRKQFHIDGSRMLITPNGDCIRGLSPEEEDTFLELQGAIASTSENPGAFVAPRHQPVNGAFSLIKGRAVPNGRPGIFPATAQPQPQDPIGKLQREDALSYINQYVLPRLNLGATNVGWPKGATLRQDAAAASLNSLAPYFYGPDAAAGVGIYSAPDGKDFYNPPPPLSSATTSAAAAADDASKFGSASNSMNGMPLMTVEDAESALMAARKETEKLEKGLNQVIKRNRRLLLGSGN